MKNIFTFLLLIFTFSAINSQTPKEKFTKSQNYVYLANLDYYKKDYKLSTKRFKEAFKIHKPEGSYDNLNAAAAAFKSGDKKFAKKMIIESITNFAAPIDFVLDYEKYKDFKDDDILKDISKNYNYYINEYYRNLKNPFAYFKVNELVVEDQNIRNLENDIAGNFNSDKANKRKIDSLFNHKMDEVDKNTSKNLIELTKKYGYQDRAWLILWHQRGQEYKDGKNEFWSFFKPIINKEIQDGNLHESFFGRFDDENEIRNGKQIYGYYIFQEQIYPLIDIKNVDERRKSIGLPPLLYDKLVYGMPLPSNYTLNEQELYNELLTRIK